MIICPLKGHPRNALHSIFTHMRTNFFIVTSSNYTHNQNKETQTILISKDALKYTATATGIVGGLIYI